MKTSPRFTFLFALSVLAVAARADDPLAYVRTEVNLIPNPAGPASADSGFHASGPVASHAATEVSTYDTALGGTYDARADYGDLTGAFAIHSQNSPTSGSFLYATDITAIDPTARFRDRLTITSATLPLGTTVAVHLNGLLTGDFATSTSGNPFGLEAETSVSAAYYWAASANVGGTFFSSSGTLSYGLANSGGSDFQATDLVAYVGGTLDLDARLYVTGDAFTNSYGAVAKASALADGRFQAGVDLLDPDASYQSLSGRRYAQAVPEPAPFVALGLGLAGLARRRR